VSAIRVGVLSDVHGSLLALEIGHDFLVRAGVDRIVCAGDVASFGPDPNECVTFLREHGVDTVAGNQDVAMLAPIDVPQQASRRVREILTINAWSQRQLTPASLAWLASLPRSLALDGGFVCVHAAPGDLRRVVTASDPKPFPDGARLVCAGHLHQPFVDARGDRTWVNAGSIARPTDGDPRGSLVVAVGDGGHWQVEIVRLPLPLEAICERIRAAGMPYARRVCETQLQSRWW
jgi:predicted phosphodiesterase